VKNSFFNYPLANIYSKPSFKSEVTSQILYGEKFKILKRELNWLKIKTAYDNYIGFIKKNKFNESFVPTKKISKLNSKIYKKKIINSFQQQIFFFSDLEFRSLEDIKSLSSMRKINGLKLKI
tara:strand:+ start:484 stop:849 length:366 start_codon:yes stop_codon:yes gene_type:complete